MRQSGLTQTALADKSGVARATVNRLALGRQDAEQATIKRLARAMDFAFPDLDVSFPETDASRVKRYRDRPPGPPDARSVAEAPAGYHGGPGGEAGESPDALSPQEIADRVAAVLAPLIDRLAEKRHGVVAAQWLLLVASEAQKQGLEDVRPIIDLARELMWRAEHAR